MTASTAPAARAAVLGLLTAALPTSDVTWGGPSETEDVTDEMVYLGKVTRTVSVRSMGQPATAKGSFTEEYRFPVLVDGRLESDDQHAAEQRAWDIVDAIEQAIRADLSLGNIVNLNAALGAQEVTAEPLTDGWLYRASVELVCTATI